MEQSLNLRINSAIRNYMENIMRLANSLLLLFILGLLQTASATLDDYYYTYDEIYHELNDLQEAYPDYIRLDSIGYAYDSELPIWSAKISDNVQINEDEPSLWVNGTCHAEEILGVNVSMAFARELVILGSQGHPVWSPILQSMEIFVVPTNNPDGMHIVMSEQDRTYRKNLHSLTDDGNCQITPGIGNDSCGVDLNRNYPGWWHRGDELWEQNSDAEQFDYFRGPYPLSEPECKAVADQTERERFVATVSYHSARTSTNHEIIIHPWSWYEEHPCPMPDYDMMNQLTRNMGDEIRGLDYEYYRNIAAKKPRGNQHCWSYAYYGSMSLLVEVGLNHDDGMQPQDQDMIDFIVEENIKGLEWLCKRIIGFQVAAPGIVAHVSDSNGDPIEARIRFEELVHPDCVPYNRTDPDFGAYYRLLSPGTYNVKIARHGFETIQEEIVIGPSLPTQASWQLTAVPYYDCSISFVDFIDHDDLSIDRIELHDQGSDTLLVWESINELETNLPMGVYDVTAYFANHIPLHRTLVLDQNRSWTLGALELGNDELMLDVDLTEFDDFEQTGSACSWVEMTDDSMGVNFSDTPDEFSGHDVNCRLQTVDSWLIDVPVRDQNPGSFSFREYHALEGARDSAFVEISVDGGANWSILKSFTGLGHRITRHSIPLDASMYGEVKFAFRVKTDDIESDVGFRVNDIHLGWNGIILSVDDEILASRFSLQASPNPFNPTTTVRLNVPAYAIASRAEFTLYDLLGREVRTISIKEHLVAGELAINVNAADLASGIYFLRCHVSQQGITIWEDASRLTLVR
jgi:hypothetical protein